MVHPNSGAELIALLGCRDEPTDGVEDYCTFLEKALKRHRISLTLVRVPWAERGWTIALRSMWCESAKWQGRWVLVQYTALSWSRRGFPLGFLAVLFLLCRKGLSIAVIFHDAEAYPGIRWVDRIRRATQHFVMRRTAAVADRVILPSNPEHLAWLACDRNKVVFVPVGSNVPAPPAVHAATEDRLMDPRGSGIVAVFGITPGVKGEQEITSIREVMDEAAGCVAGPVRLCVFGRGTREAEPALRRIFQTSEIEVSVLGLLPAEKIGEILARADVQIDVRSRISSRRGSVIAGIVCGTPVVGFKCPETDDAIREAGVVLLVPGDTKGFAAVVVRILSDYSFRNLLRMRNRIASEKSFSWDAVSARIICALREHNSAASP